jgi:hypothetical protein
MNSYDYFYCFNGTWFYLYFLSITKYNFTKISGYCIFWYWDYICLASLKYIKKEHIKQDYSENLPRDTYDINLIDLVLKRFIFKIIGVILDFLPWWTLKVIYFLLGMVFMGFSIFLLTIL